MSTAKEFVFLKDWSVPRYSFKKGETFTARVQKLAEAKKTGALHLVGGDLPISYFKVISEGKVS